MTGSKRTSIALLLSLAGPAAVIGCSTPTSASERQQARLTAAMARWASNGGSDYQLEIAWACSACPPESSDLLRIQVQGGQITEAFDVTANQAITLNDRTLTVPQLFGFIQQALDDQVFQLSTEYDQALGYPVAVSIDRDANTVNDEIAFQVSSLQLSP
jgi:hypothetical protein